MKVYLVWQKTKDGKNINHWLIFILFFPSDQYFWSDQLNFCSKNPCRVLWSHLCSSYNKTVPWMYLQLPSRQWGAGNIYLLVLSSWKVNIAENPIAVIGLYIRSGKVSTKRTWTWLMYSKTQEFKVHGDPLLEQKWSYCQCGLPSWSFWYA